MFETSNKIYFAVLDAFKSGNSLHHWLNDYGIEFEGVGYILETGKIFVNDIGAGHFKPDKTVKTYPVVEVYSFDKTIQKEFNDLLDTLKDLFNVGLSNEVYKVQLYEPQLLEIVSNVILTKLNPKGVLNNVRLLHRLTYSPDKDNEVKQIENFENIKVVYFGNFNELDSADYFDKLLFKQTGGIA